MLSSVADVCPQNHTDSTYPCAANHGRQHYRIYTVRLMSTCCQFSDSQRRISTLSLSSWFKPLIEMKDHLHFQVDRNSFCRWKEKQIPDDGSSGGQAAPGGAESSQGRRQTKGGLRDNMTMMMFGRCEDEPLLPELCVHVYVRVRERETFQC